jgi:Amt family ammonium transporter
VFDFLTYWTWNPNGWAHRFGALDYGGGTPVHISTGVAALAYAMVLGKRENAKEKPPHNMGHVILGTSFIWLGWLIANAGSGLKPNLRAVVVFITTNLAASVGGITWAAIDYQKEKKLSVFGFCCGAICGLVAVTPASGYISPSSSLVFGFLGAASCYLCLEHKRFLRVDDAFDVFCVHGMGGIVGNILTGIFAQKSIAGVDGTVIEGGWLDGNWKQVGIQLVDTLVGSAWSFVWSLIILCIIDKIPGLNLRVPLEVEIHGVDKGELGESMYQHLEDAAGAEATIPESVSLMSKINSLQNPVFVESAKNKLPDEIKES